MRQSNAKTHSKNHNQTKLLETGVKNLTHRYSLCMESISAYLNLNPTREKRIQSKTTLKHFISFSKHRNFSQFSLPATHQIEYYMIHRIAITLEVVLIYPKIPSIVKFQKIHTIWSWMNYAKMHTRSRANLNTCKIRSRGSCMFLMICTLYRIDRWGNDEGIELKHCLEFALTNFKKTRAKNAEPFPRCLKSSASSICR